MAVISVSVREDAAVVTDSVQAALGAPCAPQQFPSCRLKDLLPKRGGKRPEFMLPLPELCEASSQAPW